MITKSQAKRKQDIKTKLMAAIAMLLVSSIMMVSSTYAWFTLSTAPEVTGINTAVGANGNLEMALLPYGNEADSITTNVNDGNKELVERNKTWGNLVDLAPEGAVDYYGLNDITLYPSALNADIMDEGNFNPTHISTGSFLDVPTYGADGRISELIGTQTGVFNTEGSNPAFYPNAAEQNGVRAIGSASGLTPRQLAYRNAVAAGNTAASQAKTFASRSLSANGSALADIAIAHALDLNAKFDAADVTALRAMIDSLDGVDAAEGVEAKDGVIDYLERAYMQYILAEAASLGKEDAVYSAVAGKVNAEGATLAGVMAEFEGQGVTLPDAFNNAVTQFNGIVSAVGTAEEALEAAEAKIASGTTELAWADISGAVTPLISSEAMTVNGLTMDQVKADINKLVQSVLSQGGITLVLGSGAGVYADIADQCGNYDASIVIDKINYPVGSDSGVEDVPATMKTNGRNPSYLSAIGVAVSGKAPTTGANDNMPISDIYGYIIDLAFRTNASSSNLLLQQEGVDRIYGDNTNEETKGNGSSMIFKATTADFNDTQVKGLMDAIRIVFFNPDDNSVVATAKLDTAAAELTGDGWKAYLYLYENGASGEVRSSDNAIMALNQNEAHALSVLVYLDGNEVENKDVAATGSTSMTGSLNLQFASSAELVPMEYADLHITGNQADNDDTEATTTNITNVSVTGETGVTATAVLKGENIEITLTGYTDGQTVTVDTGAGAAPATVTEGKITVAAPEGFDAATSTVTVNVTNP